LAWWIKGTRRNSGAAELTSSIAISKVCTSAQHRKQGGYKHPQARQRLNPDPMVFCAIA
jgi:hypothetical protein